MVPISYGRTTALRATAKATGGIDPRLKPAAQEFEASLMQELLKPMERDPLFSGPSGDGSGQAGTDAGMSGWRSLGTQSLAQAIAKAGGLGIATKVIEDVKREIGQVEGRQPAAMSKPHAGMETGSQAVGRAEHASTVGEALAGGSGVRRPA